MSVFVIYFVTTMSVQWYGYVNICLCIHTHTHTQEHRDSKLCIITSQTHTQPAKEIKSDNNSANDLWNKSSSTHSQTKHTQKSQMGIGWMCQMRSNNDIIQNNNNNTTTTSNACEGALNWCNSLIYYILYYINVARSNRQPCQRR